MTWTDAWSRPGRKYRVRAVVLLAVNVLLFAGVGCFAFWLRSGCSFAPGMEGYGDQLALTFQFTGEKGVSLGSLLLEPISVERVPMQIPILGLLMAALIAVPILVSILYRFWACLPFIAIVGLLAVMPWLAITLTASCVIASLPPFRTPFRFVSALLGLLPAVIYLVLASRGTAQVVAGRIDPIDTIKFVAPWLLAIVAAASLFAIVLAIAKLVDYRTGTLTPLLALLFGLPVLLFEFHVGRDELHFRLLEALGNAYSEEVDTRADLTRAALRAWERHPLPRPRWQDVYAREAAKWQRALAEDLEPFQTELVLHQVELEHRCDEFHRAFPDSRYVCGVLYLRARVLDLRIDVEEFRRTGWIRFYDDVPSPASHRTWSILAENLSNSALGDLAQLRIAQFDARSGKVDQAMDTLTRLRARRDFGEQAGESSLGFERTKGALTRAEPEAGLPILPQRTLLDANRLLDLCASNRDPKFGDVPLSGPVRTEQIVWFGLLDLDPRHAEYPKNLDKLRVRYPGCQLEDNIELEFAKQASPAAAQVNRLDALLSKFPRGDSRPEALLRLSRALKSLGFDGRAALTLNELRDAYPHSIWTRVAERFNAGAQPVTKMGMAPIDGKAMKQDIVSP
jgi:hypothetical protein